MEVAGYIASLLIGLSLGLIGGGGSILTVPVMVYLFGMPPLLATSYSLFIVGTTSLVGALANLKKRLVNVKAVLMFGVASVLTVFLVRKFVIPAIPKTLFTVAGFAVTESLLTMLLFALLMLLASFGMIRKSSVEKNEKECRDNFGFGKLILYGTLIGLVTGLLGAGGGFLLIPVLVFLLKLPMKTAIGTSLLIIALNSLIGFAGDLGHFTIDWRLLLSISAIAMAGIFIGGMIGKRMQGDNLKKGFGWFVLIMGVSIIVKEVLLRN